MVAQTCNPREAETGRRLQIQGHPKQFSPSQGNKRAGDVGHNSLVQSPVSSISLKISRYT